MDKLMEGFEGFVKNHEEHNRMQLIDDMNQVLKNARKQWKVQVAASNKNWLQLIDIKTSKQLHACLNVLEMSRTIDFMLSEEYKEFLKAIGDKRLD